MHFLLIFFSLLFSFGEIQKSYAQPEDVTFIEGPSLITNKALKFNLHQKISVVVFLSSICPCSKSHETHLKELVQSYPQIQFIAVHSNSDESFETSKDYFVKAKLPFEIIQDNGARIADSFQAFKTPHAYVYNQKGQLVYKGGITDSHLLEKSKKKFLKEALHALVAGAGIQNREGRTLGCVISRK